MRKILIITSYHIDWMNDADINNGTSDSQALFQFNNILVLDLRGNPVSK